jgi:hypothetical protein
LGHCERVSERDLARLVDHQDVHRVSHRFACKQPRCAGDQLHLHARWWEVVVIGRGEDVAAVVVERLRVVLRAFLKTSEWDASLVGDVFDLREQVVDRLVAGRRDANTDAVAQQVGDYPSAGVGLA